MNRNLPLSPCPLVPLSFLRPLSPCLLVSLSLFLSLLLPGCVNPGKDDLVVSPDRLQKIRAIELSELTDAPPTTGPINAIPSTLPSSTPGAILPTTVPTQPTAGSTRPTPEVKLTIEDVRRLAMENNLDLRVQVLNPEISRTSITEEEARYEAVLGANIQYATFDQATTSRLDTAQGKNLSINPTLDIPLITGGTISLGAPMNRSETNNEFSLLNPSYSTDASASISQPLLRGGGADVGYHPIRIAKYDYQSTQARTKLEVMRVLAEADRVYWRLYAARRDLELRQAEYELARQQLERARRQAAAGKVADIEIIRAESGLADRLEAILTANNTLRDRQRDLKRTVNSPDLPVGGSALIVPDSKPLTVYYRIDADRLVDAALAGRMEMLELELQIARDTANVRIARNSALPLVTLDYNYNINGIGSSWASSYRVTTDKDFEDHRIGLRIEIPIGNEAAKSRLRRAILSRLQTLATREQRALTIRQEVLQAADAIASSWQRILASRQRVALAQRTLDVETRQFNLGLRTSTDVLDAQTRLADAQSSEISAVTEYQISQIDLAFATGTLLGAANVQWVSPRADSK
jgi:outer membrane protein